MIIRYILLVVVCCTLSACSTSIQDYQSTRPTIDLKTYFDGPLKAWGMVQDRNGKVTRRFTVEMQGSWQGDTGTLEEYFTYADGGKEERIWTIHKQGQQYLGTAADVMGTAQGDSRGFAFTWYYTLKLNIHGKDVHVQLKDWIYQIDDAVLINTADIKKFGITFGTVTLFIQRQ